MFWVLSVFSFLFDWGLPAEALIIPTLILIVAATGLTIQLRQKTFYPLDKFFRQVKETHPDFSRGKRTGDILSFLQNYSGEMEQELKKQEDESRRLRRGLVAVSAIAASMNQDAEVDQVLNEVLGTILEVAGFDAGIVFLHKLGEENIWDVRAWKGMQLDDLWGVDQVKVGEEILREAAKTQRTIFISDSKEDQKWKLQDFRDKGIRTIMTLPLTAKGKVYGAVMLMNFLPKEISLDENELLETIGRQLGMTINDASLLLEQTAKSHDLSLLLDAFSAFSKTLNPSRILNTLSEKILKILDADFCHTALVDPDEIHLVFQTFSATQQTASPISSKERIRMKLLPLYQRVIRTKKMVRIRGKGQLATSERQLLPLKEAREIILIPIAVEQRAMGVIGVGLCRPDELDPKNLELVKSITKQAATTLEKIRLYRELKEKADELSSLYQMAQKLSSILDWDELLNEILKVVVESFGYLNSAILLVDSKKHELYVKAAHGFSEETTRNTRIKIGKEGITGHVAQTGQPLVVGDVENDPRYVMGMRECKSEIAIPLKFKGEIIGVLDAESDKPFAFGKKDLRLLSQLASQISVMLENSRLFCGERRRYLQLALINDVGRKVVSTLDLDRLLKNVTEAIQLSLKYDQVSLFLLDESTGDFVLRTFSGSSYESSQPGCRIKEGVGMVGTVAKSGRTLVCNDVSADPKYVPAIPDTRSELALPIKKGKQVLGVLDIQSFAKDSFDEQDVAVIETVTDLLATAVNNARLYEETKAKAYRLELTDQINRAISSTLDVTGIFNVVSNEMKKVLNYDRISLSFWHPQEQLFMERISYSQEAGLSAVGCKGIPADETNMFYAVENKESFIQNKLALDAALKPMDQLIYAEGTRSYVYVPVMENEEVIAVLGLESKKIQAFGPDQVRLLESVAGHLSVAIQNARLFSELQKAYQSLKETQGGMIQVERFQALGEMAGGVVHDFNNILASILGRVQLILMKLKGGEPTSCEELEKGLKIIESSAKDGERILKRIREFTRAKLREKFGSVEINRVVEDSLELTKPYWKERRVLSGISIQVNQELGSKSSVWGDEVELKEVVNNLIVNALDAMPDGGTLTLRTEDKEDSVFLTVNDTGMGISEEIKKRIFTPFFTTKGEQGTGLGLSLVSGIVSRHRGEISVESSPGMGSSFTVRFPRYQTETETATPEKPKERSTSVLVVEDEQNIREVLDEILSTAGHQVLQASNGEEGIKIYKEHKPDLVITDLGMPGLSGWDVADAVKKESPSTPVVLFTGWGVKMDQKNAQKQIVDRFITKPFNMQQILNLVSELLR